MLQTGENETEILLGNKQLVGIFLVIAILLGVSFTGGFLVGRGSPEKKAVPTASTVAASVTDTASADSGKVGGQTHTLEPDGSATSTTRDTDAGTTSAKPPAASAVLGSRKRPISRPVATSEVEAKADAVETGYVPQAGSEYLQVAAVGKDEAEAVADVLHKKGFHAHAVPKPGNVKIYRVIIGPVKDAGDLASTRDALRKTFREVIVQRY